MRSLLVADKAFLREEKASYVFTEDTELTFFCVGMILVGLGEDLGQAWGVSAIPHSIPCAWELPKGIKTQKNPKKTHPGQ